MSTEMNNEDIAAALQVDENLAGGEGDVIRNEPTEIPAAADMTGVSAVGTPTSSNFAFVVLAAKRAKQLREGAPAFVEATGPNVLTTAIDEVEQGKVLYKLATEGKKAPEE